MKSFLLLATASLALAGCASNEFTTHKLSVGGLYVGPGIAALGYAAGSGTNIPVVGKDGKLYILQARPETVKASEKVDTLRRYRLKTRSDVLASGRAIGQRIGAGPVKLIKTAAEMDRVKPGDVLVTDMTDPDWEPVMKRASANVTNRGGRTCHAAIIARELGIPAVVGCGDATQVLKDGKTVTVSCAEGDTGFVYRGELEIEVIDLSLDAMPKAPAKITMNVGNPELAFEFRRLPNEGVGLARLEFIIARMIGVHPRAGAHRSCEQ